MEDLQKKQGGFVPDHVKLKFEEVALCKALEVCGCTDTMLNTSEDKEILKGWDVVFTAPDNVRYTGELKADYRSNSSGNVCIEYAHDGAWSGLSTTTANYWFQKLGEDYYFQTPEILRDYINSNAKKFRWTSGGDGNKSSVVLIPKNDFLTIAAKL